MIKIIDEFVSSSVQNELLNLVVGSRLPFFLNESTVSSSDVWSDMQTKDSIQLTHTMVRDGVAYPSWQHFIVLWNEFVHQTGFNMPAQKVKANITFPLRNYENTYSGAHVDHNYWGGKTAIYYINDSDGDTILFERPDKQFDSEPRLLKPMARVVPKKGRLVYFDSNIIHSGQLPTRSEFRCVINMNVYETNTK